MSNDMLSWMYMIFNKDKIMEKKKQWTKEAEKAGMTLTEYLESINPLKENNGREMPREEVIERLKSIKSLVDKYDDVVALREAVKALEQESCEDTISRHYLRKQFQEKCVGECSCCEWDSPYWCGLIDNAPPVNPQPKTGHWKYAEQLQAEICSCCGCIKGNYFFSDIEAPIKFCPNCGASMESEGAE